MNPDKGVAPQESEAFTEDDLLRWKDMIRMHGECTPNCGCSYRDVKRLLSRLEAAEKLLTPFAARPNPEIYGPCRRVIEDGRCEDCEQIEAWRKAAGR